MWASLNGSIKRLTKAVFSSGDFSWKDPLDLVAEFTSYKTEIPVSFRHHIGATPSPKTALVVHFHVAFSQHNFQAKEWSFTVVYYDRILHNLTLS